MVLKKTLERPLECKEIQPVHPKGDQSWVFIGRTDAEAETPNTLAIWWEGLTHGKRPWCWKRLKVGGEGDNRGWDAWMASPTQRTWIWVNSRSWWWTERPGVLRFMGSQRVGHNWATELNWTEYFPGGSDSKESAWNGGDWVWSLGWEDPLEENTAIHSSTLAWRIPRTEEPGWLQSMGWQRVRHGWA